MPRLLRSPDRLLPHDDERLSLARVLYAATSELPILSPHGHVEARLLAENRAFADPTSLLVSGDHYLTRLLHSLGVPLEQLLLDADASESQRRRAWAAVCSHWHDLAGTVVRYWLEEQLTTLFDIEMVPSAATADALYDSISAALAEPGFLPQALLTRFRVEVLATTDDPADSLEFHTQLQDAGLRVIPTLRADPYLDLHRPDWSSRLGSLAAAADTPTDSYAGLIAALRQRRRAFRALGGSSTDTGVLEPWCEPLSDGEAERIHAAGLAGTATEAERDAYRANLLYRFAELSAEDGMVMQLHVGVHRNTHAPTLQRFGPDTGHDLPARASFIEPLAPILRDFGTHPSFHTVLFTVDETAFSRELAPLAGFYPSVRVGAPWWFLDSPEAMLRARRATTDQIGFARGSGFVDDTRALCSIPTRHDTARRVDAAYLAELVSTDRLAFAEAERIAVELVTSIPRAAFGLGA
jgi:glucuronate isomerase